MNEHLATTKFLKNINIPDDVRKLNVTDLKTLSAEVRTFLIDVVSKTGGHLGAGLGTVELIVALHYVFDTPKDKLVFDVGHQTYPHKILTGRKDLLHTIRQFRGLSGFLRREESEYDVFGAGHASTAISAALGIATARDFKNEKFKVVAIVGDGPWDCFPAEIRFFRFALIMARSNQTPLRCGSLTTPQRNPFLALGELSAIFRTPLDCLYEIWQEMQPGKQVNLLWHFGAGCQKHGNLGINWPSFGREVRRVPRAAGQGYFRKRCEWGVRRPIAAAAWVPPRPSGPDSCLHLAGLL